MKQYLFRILLEHVRLEQRRLLRAYNWQQAQFLARDEEKIDKYLSEFPRRGESEQYCSKALQGFAFCAWEGFASPPRLPPA